MITKIPVTSINRGIFKWIDVCVANVSSEQLKNSDDN